MHNFGTVLRFELVRTLKKPTFWLSVLAFPALFAIIIGIMIYSGKTQEAREKELAKEPFSLVVLDESGVIQTPLLAAMGASKTSDKQAGINEVKTGKADAFFYYPKDLTRGKIEVHNKNDGLIDNSKYSTAATQLLKASASSNATSPNLVAALQGTTTANQTNYENGQPANLIGRIIVPAAFLVIFYLTIVLLGNQMLASTTEEKENRVTEMILTSINSRTLIIGKIVSLILLGAIQIAVMVVPALLAYIFARDLLQIPDVSAFLTDIQFEPLPIAIGAGLLVSGFLLFTGLLVGIGAASPTAKEANSFFGFVILLMIVPFYFISMLIAPNDSPVVTGLSYFPLTAPFTLLIRNAAGSVPTNEALIGLAIVAVSGVIAISLAIRIFRYGTLEYSSRISLGNLFGKKQGAK